MWVQRHLSQLAPPHAVCGDTLSLLQSSAEKGLSLSGNVGKGGAPGTGTAFPFNGPRDDGDGRNEPPVPWALAHSCHHLRGGKEGTQPVTYLKHDTELVSLRSVSFYYGFSPFTLRSFSPFAGSPKQIGFLVLTGLVPSAGFPQGQ